MIEPLLASCDIEYSINATLPAYICTNVLFINDCTFTTNVLLSKLIECARVCTQYLTIIIWLFPELKGNTYPFLSMFDSLSLPDPGY